MPTGASGSFGSGSRPPPARISRPDVLLVVPVERAADRADESVHGLTCLTRSNGRSEHHQSLRSCWPRGHEPIHGPPQWPLACHRGRASDQAGAGGGDSVGHAAGGQLYPQTAVGDLIKDGKLSAAQLEAVTLRRARTRGCCAKPRAKGRGPGPHLARARAYGLGSDGEGTFNQEPILRGFSEGYNVLQPKRIKSHV